MLESSQRKSGSFKAVYILIVRSGIMMKVSFIFVRLNFILVVENLVLSVGGRWYLIFVQCVIRINSKAHWVWHMLKSVPSKKKKSLVLRIRGTFFAKTSHFKFKL